MEILETYKALQVVQRKLNLLLLEAFNYFQKKLHHECLRGSRIYRISRKLSTVAYEFYYHSFLAASLRGPTNIFL